MVTKKEQQEQATQFLKEAGSDMNSFRKRFKYLKKHPETNGKGALNLLHKLEELLQKLVELKNSSDKRYFNEIRSKSFSAACDCSNMIANIESHLLGE